MGKNNLFESDIPKSAEAIGLWYRRMRDMTLYRNSGSPFDFLLFKNGVLVGLECKMLRARKSGNPKSIAFSQVTDTQREGMVRLHKEKGGYGFVGVNFRWVNNKKGEVFILPIDEFLSLEEKFDRKSIPLDYFREECISLPRYESGWDLRLLFPFDMSFWEQNSGKGLF